MRCPNCGKDMCHCTWDEMQQAYQIMRRQESEKRIRDGEPTVVEREAARIKGFCTIR